MCLFGIFLPLIFLHLTNCEESAECNHVEYIGNPLRGPTMFSASEEEQSCDSHIVKSKWYDLGGEISSECPEVGKCSTISGIWYDGNYPKGDEAVTSEVCGIDTEGHCCTWKAPIQIRKCSIGYIYKLTAPTDCPRAYCVGSNHGCTHKEIHHKSSNTCLSFPEIKLVTIGQPFISDSKMIGTFKASAFSIECSVDFEKTEIKAIPYGRPQVMIIFLLNKDMPGRFVENYPSNKVIMNETHLIGHIGKEIKCQAQFRYIFDDGTLSQRTEERTSPGYKIEIYPQDKENNRLTHVEIQQGLAFSISLKSTFPITSAHCFYSDSCSLTMYKLEVAFNTSDISQDKCYFIFDPSSSSQISSAIRIVAKTTYGTETSNHFLIFKTFNTDVKGVLFQGLQVEEIKVIVKETTKVPVCQSIGALYFQTFEGLTFDGYGNGNFELLSTSHRIMQIQIRQVPCFGTISCICGIMAREGNNIIGINACDDKRDPLAVELMRDNVNARAYIIKKKTDFTIVLPSGIEIDVLPYSVNNVTYMNIFVRALKHEMYGGICAAKAAPDSIAVFKISSLKAYFQKTLPPCVKEIFDLPFCICNLKQGPTACEQETLGAYEGLVKLTNVCDLESFLDPSAAGVGRGEVPELKSANDEADRGFTLGYIFLSVNSGMDNVKVKPSEQMNQQKASDLCNEAMKKTHFFIDCQSYSEAIIKKCADGLKYSGSVDVVESYVRTFEHYCLINLKSSIEIVDGKSTPSSENSVNAVKKLEDGFCPMCKNNGTCSQGACSCLEGFAGLYCSIDVRKSPSINLAHETNFCDPAMKPCYMINVETTISSPQDVTTVKCVVAVYGVSGELEELEVITKEVQPGYLQCLLDKTFHQKGRVSGKKEYAVYNTFHNGQSTVKSNVLKVVIYNGTCLECHETNCKPKKNTCFIEEMCYETNQTKTDELYCNPNLSQIQWSKKSGVLTPEVKKPTEKTKEKTKRINKATVAPSTVQVGVSRAEREQRTQSVATVGIAVGMIGWFI